MTNSGAAVARKLILLSGGTTGVVYPLAEPKIGLGRDADNAIRLEGTCISRHHAVLDRTNGEYTLRDLQSRNGTFLNGQPVQDAHLKPGDRVRLGEIELSYEVVEEPTVTALPVASMTAPVEELAELRRQLATVQQQLTAAVQQAGTRATELELARRTATTVGEQSATQLEKLTQQNGTLSADLVAARKQIEELRAAAGRATDESAQLRAQAGTAATEQQQRIAQLTADVDRLAAELRVAKEALPVAQAELEAARRTGHQQSLAIQSATAKQAGLATEVERLQIQLEQAQQGVGKTEEQKQVLAAELADVRGQLTAARQRGAEQLAKLNGELDLARQDASRLPELTDENDRLKNQNTELLARVSALELCETQINPLKAELTTLRDALQRANAELVEIRTTVKLEAMKDRLAQLSGTMGQTEYTGLQAELTQACADWAELRQLPPVVERLTRENEALRIVAAKAQEETKLAKRCLSDQTTEEFAQIRRAMPAKTRGNGGTGPGAKDGGLLHQLDAARRAFGILPK